MNIFDYYNNTLEDFYYNPDIVLISLALIVFAVSFSILMKTRLNENRGIVIIVSSIISLISIYYIDNAKILVGNLNILLVLAVIILIIFLFIPLLKFLKRNY